MLLLFLIIGCGLFTDAKRASRIYNGEDALIEKYPYQVSLEASGAHICGGSIIAKNYVLTAAHCANLIPKTAKLSVRAGTTFRSKGGSLHTVVEFIRHKEYNIKKFLAPHNDIAIVKVEEPFHYDDSRKSIELFEDNEEAPAEAKSVVTGFGLVSVSKLADQLQSVELTIVSKQDCKKIYKNLPPGQICARGENGKDSCTGDSGGPIAVGGRLAGIVSWGGRCGSPKPSAYTEVAYYLDWIKKYVQFDKINKEELD